MAIHRIVFVTPDRRTRIMADPAGHAFTIERDQLFEARLTSMFELERWLAQNGLSLADLDQA